MGFWGSGNGVQNVDGTRQYDEGAGFRAPVGGFVGIGRLVSLLQKVSLHSPELLHQILNWAVDQPSACGTAPEGAVSTHNDA